MNREDIECYRINYDKSWLRNGTGVLITLPAATILAINALCDEIDRLKKWKSTRQK